MNSNLQNSLVKATALNIKEYIDDKYGIEVDIYDLIEIIHYDIGWVVEAAAEAGELGRMLNNMED